MISPEQTLLHLTSQGTRVRALQPNLVGNFINSTNQPLTNINKFGLLHYSIPKTLDMIKNDERTFFIQIEYEDPAQEAAQFEVVLPLMDYYSITVDTPPEYTANDQDRLYDNQACLTEILQTSINWAIQKYRAPAPQVAGGRVVANRLGCIVRSDKDGRLEFFFGYRGNTHLVTPTEDSAASGPFKGLGAGTIVVKPNTGCPYPQNLSEPANEEHGWLRVMAQDNNRYSYIDTQGNPQTLAIPRPASIDDEDLRKTYAINKISFRGLSRRVMNLLGATTSDFFYTSRAEDTSANKDTGEVEKKFTQTMERGRICLVDYKVQGFDAQGQPIPGQEGDPGSNILRAGFYCTPNLFPPSFLFLNLLAQGTRTKVLGHDSERGGWAVPCASNEFVSGYDNYPWTQMNAMPAGGAEYSIHQVRNMPMLLNLQRQSLAKSVAKGTGGQQTPVFFQDIGGTAGSRFDPKVPYPEVNAYEWGHDHPVYPDLVVKAEDNFSLVVNTDLMTVPEPIPQGAPSGTTAVLDMAKQFKFGAQMIHYGDLKTAEAPASSAPRKRFGNGVVNASPTFTVSMITPMYIYTDVPNATVQTLDVQLLWGDTATNVNDTSSEPCQFSLIASQ